MGCRPCPTSLAQWIPGLQLSPLLLGEALGLPAHICGQVQPEAEEQVSGRAGKWLAPLSQGTGLLSWPGQLVGNGGMSGFMLTIHSSHVHTFIRLATPNPMTMGKPGAASGCV